MDIALIVLGIVFVISAASYLISKLVKRQEAQTSIVYPFHNLRDLDRFRSRIDYSMTPETLCKMIKGGGRSR